MTRSTAHHHLLQTSRHLCAFAVLLCLALPALAISSIADPEPISLAPKWQQGQRTVWTITSTQSVAAEPAASTEPGTDAPAARSTAQTLRLRITVLTAPPSTSLGIAFESLTLRTNDQTAEATETKPADDAQPAPEPAKPDSPLAELASLYLSCALRADVDPNGRITSLTGLERIREWLADHPEHDATLGPIGPLQITRTLESLWLFDAPDAPPRNPADTWTLNERITLPGIGKAELTSEWTLTQPPSDSPTLSAKQTVRLNTPVDSSTLTPALTIREQQRTVRVTLSPADHTAQRIDHDSRLVISAQLGTDRSATATVQSRTVTERVPPAPAP